MLTAFVWDIRPIKNGQVGNTADLHVKRMSLNNVTGWKGQRTKSFASSASLSPTCNSRSSSFPDSSLSPGKDHPSPPGRLCRQHRTPLAAWSNAPTGKHNPSQKAPSNQSKPNASSAQTPNRIKLPDIRNTNIAANTARLYHPHQQLEGA